MLGKVLGYFSLGISSLMALVCLVGIFTHWPAQVQTGVQVLFLVFSLLLSWLSFTTIRQKT